MLTKGAVVIVKRGDLALANAMEKGVVKKSVDEKTAKDLKRDNKFLKKHSSEWFEMKIARAQRKYGRNPHPPAWLRKIKEGIAFVIYQLVRDRRSDH